MGVQVLAMSRPFQFSMPVLQHDALPAGAITAMEDCVPLCLDNVSHLSLTVECLFAPAAKGGLRIHIRSSHDGYHYDTTDWQTVEVICMPGQTVRKTVEVNASIQFAKLVVENLDREQGVSQLALTATMGG
jgi:hypothetical protein